MNVTVKIDTTGFSKGALEAAKYSKRTLPEIINTSAYWVAVNTKNMMPFVTPERVDAELAVISSPVIGKRGKPLKRKRMFRGGMSPAQNNKEVPLSALIVAARANPNSRYNQVTNQRYALARNPFKGVSRAAGAAAMRALEDKMIKSRHRSGKFLLAGWVRVVRIMAQYAVQKYVRGGANPNEGAKSYYGADLGTAQPAREGWACTAVIENDVGLEGQNAESFNRALWKHGAAPLQYAVNQEGARNLEYAMKKFEAEMAERVNKHWS